MKEIRRRTRVVGAFPNGRSCLNLAATRLRCMIGKMPHEHATTPSAASSTYLKPKPLHDRMCERILDTTSWLRAEACASVGRRVVLKTSAVHDCWGTAKLRLSSYWIASSIALDISVKVALVPLSERTIA
jgi:hypothetical protein